MAEARAAPALGDAAVGALAKRYDAQRGGFGGAPKFPPSTTLEFLLRTSERPAADRPAAGRALAMAAGTLEAMARGGMYDQLGGGFARYSVDADWVVPHFEKMLYDNAQLARVYAHWWRRSGGELARRVAEQTCDWMIADLRTGEGGLASALDADSDGKEGAFYVWTPEELTGVLGEADGAYAAELFGVTGRARSSTAGRCCSCSADPASQDRYQQVRSALLAARSSRVWPGRDDKVVAAWNGLAITALAEAGLLFGRPDYVEAAAGAAELLGQRAHRRRPAGEDVDERRRGAQRRRPRGLRRTSRPDILTLAGVTGQRALGRAGGRPARDRARRGSAIQAAASTTPPTTASG